jgi:hypothetical protein
MRPYNPANQQNHSFTLQVGADRNFSFTFRSSLIFEDAPKKQIRQNLSFNSICLGSHPFGFAKPPFQQIHPKSFKLQDGAHSNPLSTQLHPDVSFI